MAAWQNLVNFLGPDLARIVVGLVGVLALVQVNALFLVWLERKVAAHIQLRIGPKEVGPFGILQTIVDGIKLVGKELITPRHVDRKLFMLAPIAVFLPVLVSFVVIPFSEHLVIRDMNVGLLLIFAFLHLQCTRGSRGWLGLQQQVLFAGGRPRGGPECGLRDSFAAHGAQRGHVV